MDVGKSILLQKQVRDNTEDLRSEFLDMKNWEEQMRRRDAELSNVGDDKLLPPVRSRKKTAKNNELKMKNQQTKKKRITSSDYASWDKFDVEKACKDLDSEASESGDEALSREELERNREEALLHKDKGNVLVKKQQWTEAVKCYNEAIKIFPYDAVFYANRAFCYLKIDNLHSAESDCTTAIQLDEFYVKAYHRRATARKELKQYKEAKQDLEKVLKLDPTNKDARAMLIAVDKQFEGSKSAVESAKDIEDEVPVEKRIGEKVFGRLVAKPKLIETVSMVKKKKPMCWMLGEGEDVAVVQPISKPPHQRSKKSLKRIRVEEIKLGESEVSSDIEIIGKSEVVVPVESEPLAHVEALSLSSFVELPPVPRTTVQFFINWKQNKNSNFRFQYLKQIPPGSIPKIFQDSMEPDTFSEILSVLRGEFIKRKEPLFTYLEDLSQVKRFGALTMFMTAADKTALEEIFQYCGEHEKQSREILALLRKKYEI